MAIETLGRVTEIEHRHARSVKLKAAVTHGSGSKVKQSTTKFVVQRKWSQIPPFAIRFFQVFTRRGIHFRTSPNRIGACSVVRPFALIFFD